MTMMMMRGAAALAAVTIAAAALAADGYKPTPPKLARSLSEAQVDELVHAAPAGSNVGVPAWYARQAAAYRPVATNQLAAAVPALGAVIQDSREHIPELAGLSDIEVAELYMAQMAKPVEELQVLAPTNSMEYLIGAGMRADLLARKEARRD